ncbi:MAG: ABC transporter ATP-binding protein [Lentisphaeria bacterium]
MANAIETIHLTKHYRGSFFRLKKTPALKDLSLVIPEGGVFGFLGPNGAGKTTTIRCLMGLVTPTAGEARVLDEPASSTRVKEQIGFLPDTPSFAGHLTANEFLLLCARLFKMGGATARQRVAEVLEEVDMAPHGHSRLDGFSRGMLQRIGIAQAILNRPRLLILDEPLLGLDPHGRDQFKQIIRRQQTAGATIFFCSHILSDVEKMCESVGILDHGELQAAGKLSELLDRNGQTVLVPAACAAVVQELLPLCTASQRHADGDYLFDFDEAGARRVAALTPGFPPGVHVRPHYESLEDFFFRMTGRGKTGESRGEAGGQAV